MAEKSIARRWSLRKKLIVIVPIVIIVLGLALGLGLGLGLGEDDDDSDSPPPTSTFSPLPSPNTTLPWTPRVNDTWQIILSHPPVIDTRATSTTPDVSIFDVDLFDTPISTIRQLHSLGKRVICYFSAGSYEDWRSDAGDFKDADKGKNLDGWPGEKWLKLGSENVRLIMRKRIVLAKSKDCDGVDPDNVDGYQNENGLGLTQNDSITYMQFLASITRPLNLTLGLKNAGDIISSVLPVVDFSVNEQCAKYSECSTFRPFIEAGKPVFHIEYPADDGSLTAAVLASGFDEKTTEKYCKGKENAGATEGFSTVLKNMELDGWVQYCDGRVMETGVNEDVGGHK